MRNELSWSSGWQPNRNCRFSVALHHLNLRVVPLLARPSYRCKKAGRPSCRARRTTDGRSRKFFFISSISRNHGGPALLSYATGGAGDDNEKVAAPSQPLFVGLRPHAADTASPTLAEEWQ